jgi:hypothetical protein
LEPLDQLELHKLILQILTPERVVWVEDDGVEKEFKLTYPSNVSRLRALELESRLIRTYIKDGLFSEEDVPEEFVEKFFSSDDSERLQELASKVKAYSALLAKRLKGTDKYESDKKKLQELKSEYQALDARKDVVNQFSAEAQARQDSQYLLLSESCYTLDGSKVWTSPDSMLNSSSANLVQSLLQEFIDLYWGPPISHIRQLARSGQWRNLYVGSTRVGMDLFGGSAKDLTLPQMQLLSWSMQYQSIFELPLDERPSQDIIDNDEKFDKFIDEYSNKIKAGSLKKTTGRDSGRGSDDQHTIVTANADNYVKLHKADAYSDPAIISGRAKDSTSYNEAKEAMTVRNKVKKSRRKASNKLKRGPVK